MANETEKPEKPEKPKYPEGLEEGYTEFLLQTAYRLHIEANQDSSVFKAMVEELGGVETTKRMLAGDSMPDSYKDLAAVGSLDLTVEAIVADIKEFQPLFDEAMIEKCRQRLKQFGY